MGLIWLSGNLRLKKRLKDLLGLDLFVRNDINMCIESDEKNNIYRKIRFVISVESDFDMPCDLLLPEGVKNPPLIVCLQGHSSGFHLSAGITKFDSDGNPSETGDDYGIQAVSRNMAALCIEQRYFGERSLHPETRDPECYIPINDRTYAWKNSCGRKSLGRYARS